MAVDTLTTAINAMIDRIVTLEPLSIAEVTAGTFATKQWRYINAELPYWVNRPGALALTKRRDIWTQNLTSSLIIAHIAVGTVGTNTPQELAWQYIPEVLRYFTAIRTTLAPSGFVELDYIAPEGLIITCPRGLDSLFLPQTRFETLYIDFEFIVPFMLVGT